MLPKDSYDIVAARCHDQSGQFAPVDVVDRPGVISGQCADALPHRLAVRRRDASVISGLVLLPDLQGLIVAAGDETIAFCIERQTPDGRGVRGEGRHARPVAVLGVLLENLRCVVVTRRRQDVLVRMPSHL